MTETPDRQANARESALGSCEEITRLLALRSQTDCRHDSITHAAGAWTSTSARVETDSEHEAVDRPLRSQTRRRRNCADRRSPCWSVATGTRQGEREEAPVEAEILLSAGGPCGTRYGRT